MTAAANLPNQLMIAALLIPWTAALLIPLFQKFPNIREFVTLIASGLQAFVVWSLYLMVMDEPALLKNGSLDINVLHVVPNLELAFKIEPLGLLFGLVASSLWIVNSIYSIGYMRANREPRQTLFYVCFAIAIGATIALAFSKNLFTLFLFYEALTLSTYPLVTHKGTPEAMKAGRVYLGLLIGTSMVLLLPAIIITGYFAGSLEFAQGGILGNRLSGEGLGLLLGLFVFGIGKAALMPGHFWLPAAMVAPTPVSALLHAVAVVKAGVFTIVKVIVYVFGIKTLRESGSADWLMWAAGFTVIAASVVALKQDNLKKRLAYSTISQLSYVVLAAAVLTPISMMGAVIHIAGHAVSKITLFFAAGSIYTASHKTNVSELNGIGWKMPWTMGAFAVGSLAMIGLPPTAGFISKWFMLQGALESAQWLPIGVIIVSTMLNAGYFLPILLRAFFCPPNRTTRDSAVDSDHGEAPWPMVLALTLTALMALLLFFSPVVPLTLARMMIAG